MPGDSPALPLRPATEAEAAAIARFHVAVWRETYRGIAPPDAYAQLDEARRLPHWRAALAAKAPGRETLIAIDDNGIAGLVSFGPPGSAVFGDLGEVKHLYVRSDTRGTGLGRRLLTEAMGRIARAGHPGTGLAVVRENTAARRFYAAMGGVETATFRDPGPLWKSDNILVVWRPDAPA